MTRIVAITTFHDELLAGFSYGRYWLDGWGSADGQTTRFDALVRAAGYRGGSVVDYGCGTGALRPYLATLGYPFTYLGVDMNDTMLDAARSLDSAGEFRHTAADAMAFPPADYVFASGVFQFADRDDPRYHHRLVDALFRRCRVALAVNFLSALRDEAVKDPAELYVLPDEAVEIASSLSGRWILDHSYHPDRGDLTVGVHV